MPQQPLVNQPGRNNQPFLAGGLYPVYTQNAADTVVLAVALPLLLTTNVTYSTNLVGTTAVNTFTIGAPPCNGFIKGINQLTTGSSTITAVAGVNIYNNATLLANVAIPAKASVRLIGYGNDWHVYEATTPDSTSALVGSLSAVYTTAAPNTVATASGAVLSLTSNQTISTNGSGTNSFTIGQPPISGFIKRITQTGAGNATVVVAGGSGATLNNGGAAFTTLTVATASEVILIGSGVGWYIINTTGTITAA